MTTRIVNHYSAFLGQSNGSPENILGESLTVPDMALSLETLFARYVRTGEIRDGVYNDVIPPGVENLDLMERADMLRDVRGTVLGLQSNLREAAFERKRKKEELKKEIVPPGAAPMLPTE